MSLALGLVRPVWFSGGNGDLRRPGVLAGASRQLTWRDYSSRLSALSFLWNVPTRHRSEGVPDQGHDADGVVDGSQHRLGETVAETHRLGFHPDQHEP